MTKWCYNYESGEYEYIDRDGFSWDSGKYVFNWDDSEYKREEEEQKRREEEEEENRQNSLFRNLFDDDD